jgi:hypothetical protein
MRRLTLVALLIAIGCFTSCKSQLSGLCVEKEKVTLGAAHFLKAAAGCDTDNDGKICGLEWVKLVKDFIEGVRQGNPDAAPPHPPVRD